VALQRVPGQKHRRQDEGMEKETLKSKKDTKDIEVS